MTSFDIVLNETCSKCKGTGSLRGIPCWYCSGTGYKEISMVWYDKLDFFLSERAKKLEKLGIKKEWLYSPLDKEKLDYDFSPQDIEEFFFKLEGTLYKKELRGLLNEVCPYCWRYISCSICPFRERHGKCLKETTSDYKKILQALKQEGLNLSEVFTSEFYKGLIKKILT